MAESGLNNLINKKKSALSEESKILIEKNGIFEPDFSCSFNSKDKKTSNSENKQKIFKENLSQYRYLPQAIYGKYGIITDSEHIHDKLYQELASFLRRRKTSSLEDIPFELEKPNKQLSSRRLSQSLDNVADIVSIRKILENTMQKRLKENSSNEEHDAVRIIDNILEEEEKKDLLALSDNEQNVLQSYSFDISSQQRHSLFPQKLSFSQNSNINTLNTQDMREKTYLVKYREILSEKTAEPTKIFDPLLSDQHSTYINKNSKKISILNSEDKNTFKEKKSPIKLETNETNKERKNLLSHWETKTNSKKIYVEQKCSSKFHGFQNDVIYSANENTKKLSDQLVDKSSKPVLDRSVSFSRDNQKHWQYSPSTSNSNFISLPGKNHHCKNSNIKLVLRNDSIIKDRVHGKTDVSIGKWCFYFIVVSKNL